MKESLNGYDVTGLTDDLHADEDIFNYAVTNTYTGKNADFVKLSGTKTWADANDRFGKRPGDIALKVYRGIGTAQPVLLDDTKVAVNWISKTGNSWSYT